MSIKVSIKDGKGSNREARIDENHGVVITNSGVPASNINTSLKPFSAFLKDSTNSSDMRVAGTLAAPIDFYIEATDEGDFYIQTLSFTIADAAAALSDFGALTALTNGCQLIYEDAQLGDVILADSLKSNFDFIQLCNFEPMFGTGTDSFRASNVVGASEAFIPLLDVEDVFGIPFGIKLPKGSTKKLKIRVRDNTTGVDRFDVRVFGFIRILNE